MALAGFWPQRAFQPLPFLPGRHLLRKVPVGVLLSTFFLSFFGGGAAPDGSRSMWAKTRRASGASWRTLVARLALRDLTLEASRVERAAAFRPAAWQLLMHAAPARRRPGVGQQVATARWCVKPWEAASGPRTMQAKHQARAPTSWRSHKHYCPKILAASHCNLERAPAGTSPVSSAARPPVTLICSLLPASLAVTVAYVSAARAASMVFAACHLQTRRMEECKQEGLRALGGGA